jgi:fatty acid kinase fatty acid binding subunit
MIRFVIDSTCDAPDELLLHPAVAVVPLYVVFGQENLRDKVDITRDEFWRRLPSAKPPPTTSQAPPAGFLAPFRQYTDAGGEIITLVISSKLSRTYDSAISAQAELPHRPIDVVDSLTTTIGIGLLLQEGLRMAEAGRTRAEIVARLNARRPEVHILFAVETLEYLARGGRIGKAQAFLGTTLNLKPLLAIVEGEVVPVSRARGKRKVLQDMIDHLAHQVPARGPKVHLAVLDACAPEEADELAVALSTRFETPNVWRTLLGPAIGAHVGPGTIGAAAYVSEY